MPMFWIDDEHRNLEHFFHPKSVAVIGASDKPRSVGATVLHNLVASGFAGRAFGA